MTNKFNGHLRKMSHQIKDGGEVDYSLRIFDPKMVEKLQGKEEVDQAEFKQLEDLNPYLGQKIKLEYQDQINCINCGRKTNKSFNQGYCFPCMNNLAECDTCIIKPELCHFDHGTCRDPEFGESHCNIPHSIYLSLTSGVKIGVTRQYQEKTRWVDQGAIQAIRVITVKRRWHAGLLEVEIAKNMADKTNWRRMLKNEHDDVDLEEKKSEILSEIREMLEVAEFDDDLSYIIDDKLLTKDQDQNLIDIKYPVLEYPQKIKSFNLDKDPIAEGTLMGIKGQYLIMDTGVINLRKYAGYLVNVELN